MVNALIDLKVPEASRTALFRAVAGIMWLGNVEYDTTDPDKATLQPEDGGDALKFAAELFGADATVLRTALTMRNIGNRSVIMVPPVPQMK